MKLPAFLARLPITPTLRAYRREWLWRDLAAGLAVAAIQIPTAIAYAQLAGSAPIVGLYASILPLAAYALFSSSRQLIVGPDAATCAMIGATIAPLATAGMAGSQALSSALAILVGFFALLGARFHLGRVADFLSRPILTGFMNGIALVILVGQIPRILGFSLQSHEVIPQLVELLTNLPRTRLPSLIIGLATITILVATMRWLRRWPAALVGIIAASVISLFMGEPTALIGQLPAGLPKLFIPAVDYHDIALMLTDAAGIAVMSFCSGMLTARSFAARRGYEVNAQQEFLAFGAANIVSGLSGGYAISGASSRTAVNVLAGGKTPLVNLFSAIATAAVVLWLTGWLAHIPVPALGAVLVVAAIGLFDLNTLRQLRRLSPFEFRLCLAATLGVITIGVLPGIAVAVGLALFKVLQDACRPRDALLGEVPGMEQAQPLDEYPDARPIPGIVIYRFDASPLFFNCDHLKQRMREVVAKAPQRPHAFLYVAEAASNLDVTAGEALETMRQELETHGIAFGIARARGQFREMLYANGLAHRIGEERLFTSVRDGIAYFRRA